MHRFSKKVSPKVVLANRDTKKNDPTKRAKEEEKKNTHFLNLISDNSNEFPSQPQFSQN